MSSTVLGRDPVAAPDDATGCRISQRRLVATEIVRLESQLERHAIEPLRYGERRDRTDGARLRQEDECNRAGSLSLDVDACRWCSSPGTFSSSLTGRCRWRHADRSAAAPDRAPDWTMRALTLRASFNAPSQPHILVQRSAREEEQRGGRSESPGPSGDVTDCRTGRPAASVPRPRCDCARTRAGCRLGISIDAWRKLRANCTFRRRCSDER